MSITLPGWYPDPQQPGYHRYWDGSQWTEQVQATLLFDGLLNIAGTLLTKQQRLMVTGDGLSWGEEQLRWDEVTWFDQLTTVQSGIPISYELWIRCGDRQIHVGFGARVKRETVGQQAYDIILGQLRRTIGHKVLSGLLKMVEAGETIKAGGLVLSPAGFAQENQAETIPWSRYAGIDVNGYQAIFVELYANRPDGKRKRACRVKIDMLRSWVVPPVIEEHARRYAGSE